jgi:hypothetical protein
MAQANPILLDLAQALQLVRAPLPYKFKHISVHMVHILARMAAKKAVQQELRDQGVRVSLVPPREISERATTYLHDNPDV